MSPRSERTAAEVLDARRKAHEGRVFALTLTGGFLFLAAVGLWRRADLLLMAALAMAVISLLAALLVPGRLTRVSAAWMQIGESIGRVTTPILLAVIYYLVVTPIAVTRRALSRRQPQSGSSWHRRPPLPPPPRLERQF